jgi:hypothetical protein
MQSIDLTLFLKEDYAEAFHQKAIPHVGEHAKTYVQLAQCIAMIDQLIETPFFEQCLQRLKTIDPSGLLEEEFGFFETPFSGMLKELHDTIEKEKRTVIRIFRKALAEKDFMEKVVAAIEKFHEKKDGLCRDAFHQFEYIVERRRLDKIMAIS